MAVKHFPLLWFATAAVVPLAHAHALAGSCVEGQGVARGQGGKMLQKSVAKQNLNGQSTDTLAGSDEGRWQPSTHQDFLPHASGSAVDLLGMSQKQPCAMRVVDPDNTDFFSVDFSHEPVVPCGAEPDWVVSDGDAALGRKPRVAIVLRGENFRPTSKYPCHVVHCDPEPQLNILRDILSGYVQPLEERGFEIDIAAVVYPSPFNSLIQTTLGAHLKVFEVMKAHGSSQDLGAYSSMVALVRHAQKEKIWYNYVVLCRIDVGPGPGPLRGLLDQPPGHIFFIQEKHPGEPFWCTNMHEANHWEGIGFASGDLIQAMSGTVVGCFLDMMYNQGDPQIMVQNGKGSRLTPGPFWPVECLPSYIWPSLSRIGGSFAEIGAEGLHCDIRGAADLCPE